MFQEEVVLLGTSILGVCVCVCVCVGLLSQAIKDELAAVADLKSTLNEAKQWIMNEKGGWNETL